jgi:pilus assembly protein CpaB
MRPKSIILLILALGCGLIAAVGINQVMASRRQAEAASGETTPIFVALADVEMGDPLTPEVLKLEEWPKDKVPFGAIQRLEDIEGRRTRRRFVSGEPILEGQLFARGDSGSGATDLIPKGFRVVTVKVDDVSGSGLILPGDRVDVLVHLDQIPGQATGKTTTKTFLQNIKVFAVNDTFMRDRDGETTIAAKTISLLVTPQQAEQVTLANNLGRVRLVMRSPNEEEQVNTTGVTTDDLFRGREGTPGPDLAHANPAGGNPTDLLKFLTGGENKQEASPPIPGDDKSWRMVVIEGDAVVEVQFDDGDRVGVANVVGTQNGADLGGAPQQGLPSDGAPQPSAEPNQGPSGVTTGIDALDAILNGGAAPKATPEPELERRPQGSNPSDGNSSDSNPSDGVTTPALSIP